MSARSCQEHRESEFPPTEQLVSMQVSGIGVPSYKSRESEFPPTKVDAAFSNQGR